MSVSHFSILLLNFLRHFINTVFNKTHDQQRIAFRRTSISICVHNIHTLYIYITYIVIQWSVRYLARLNVTLFFARKRATECVYRMFRFTQRWLNNVGAIFKCKCIHHCEIFHYAMEFPVHVNNSLDIHTTCWQKCFHF